jgi:hypothetical protein
MANTINLSRIMHISWTVQKAKACNRRKALRAAWAILQNEDVVIQYTALRLNHNRPVKTKTLNQMSIFNQ